MTEELGKRKFIPRADIGYELIEEMLGREVHLYTKKGPVLRGQISKVQGKFLVLVKDQKEMTVALDTIASAQAH